MRRRSHLFLIGLACAPGVIGLGLMASAGQLHASSEPSGSALPASPVAAPLEAERAGSSEVMGRAPAVDPAEASAPSDLAVSVTRDEKGKIHITVRRPDHLVILRSGDARDGGSGEASLVLDSLAKQVDEPVIWETADLRSLAAARGSVRVVIGEGPAIRAAAVLVDTPEPAATLEGNLHRCVAYPDGSGGFSVLCRMKAGAWRVAAANITGADPERDVWIINGIPAVANSVDLATGLPNRDTFARLDIPLSPGDVEGRVVGYMAAATGVLVRAEASRLPGEDSSILLAASSRAQAFSFGIPMKPPPPSRRSLEDLEPL